MPNKKKVFAGATAKAFYPTSAISRHIEES